MSSSLEVSVKLLQHCKVKVAFLHSPSLPHKNFKHKNQNSIMNPHVHITSFSYQLMSDFVSSLSLSHCHFLPIICSTASQSGLFWFCFLGNYDQKVKYSHQYHYMVSNVFFHWGTVMSGWFFLSCTFISSLGFDILN